MTLCTLPPLPICSFGKNVIQHRNSEGPGPFSHPYNYQRKRNKDQSKLLKIVTINKDEHFCRHWKKAQGLNVCYTGKLCTYFSGIALGIVAMRVSATWVS